jgi:phytoene synthase
LEIPLSAVTELIEGCRSDAGLVRVRTHGELLRYAYRVAGTVGVMMCGVLGVKERERAIRHAIDLGVAMQLTNISRDVLTDAEMDRIYLPAIPGAQDAETPAEAILDREADIVRARTQELLELADSYYSSAVAGLPFIPFRSRVAIGVAAFAYRAIGLKVRARSYAFRAPRAVVSTSEKFFWAAWGALRAVTASKRHHDAELHRALLGLPGTNPGIEDAPMGGEGVGALAP